LLKDLVNKILVNNINQNTIIFRRAVIIFLIFAFSYFTSALIRAITATLSPTLTIEFELQARDLGLLGAGYFLGFAAMQLPAGYWLDKYGPKKVILILLSVAVLSCLAFSISDSFIKLLISRMFIGIGVSACLMAPLTGYRKWFPAEFQQRLNSWMLMFASFGMLVSTVPVQFLLPVIGWRWIFFGLAMIFLLLILLIFLNVPDWENENSLKKDQSSSLLSSYYNIFKDNYFKKLAPVAFFNYGGFVAIQTLWAGPWLKKMSGLNPVQAASGLFWMNFSMMIGFLGLGIIVPYLYKKGLSINKIITYSLPFSFIALLNLILSGTNSGTFYLTLFLIFSISSTLGQPAVGMHFSKEIAGKALSAFNLLIFTGAFVTQWGIGLIIDLVKSFGYSEIIAFQTSFAVLLCCCIASYLFFLTKNK
jgi:MFS family permease